jgi:hypothetical protein
MKRVLIGVVAGLLLAGGTAEAATHWVITSKSQIKPSVRAQLRGNRGPQGLKGAQGGSGPTGATGPAGISAVHYVAAPAVAYCALTGGSCSVANTTATCPAGSYAVGGAANGQTIETTISTFISPTSYGAVLANDSSFTGTLNVTVACVSGPGLTAAGVSVDAKRVSNAGASVSILAHKFRSEQQR